MASSALNCAISYALRSIGKASIQLKKEQKEALASVYKGQDTFVWLPTRGGDSYQKVRGRNFPPASCIHVVEEDLGLKLCETCHNYYTYTQIY